MKKKDAEIEYLRANLEEIIKDHAEFRDFIDQNARHIRKLIIEYGQRLQVLQVKEAQKGIDLEPSVIIEIQKIRTKLEELYKKARETTVHTDALIKQMIEED